MPLLGSYSIRWNSGANIFNLQAPFQEVRPSRARTTKTRWALDGSAVERRRIGTGYYDAVVVIRWQDNPQAFVDMLVAGIEDGEVLDYHDGTSTLFSFVIAQPNEVPVIDFDEHQKALDEHTLTLRIRRVDGGNFSGIF